jgi:hypothetical protein
MPAVCVAFRTKRNLRNQHQLNKCAAADIWPSTVTKGMADNSGYRLEILIQIWHWAEN